MGSRSRCVALIAGQSLLIEGVASRLLDHAGEVDLHTFDPEESDLLASVANLEPQVVLLDEQDPFVRERCPLAELMRALPNSRILLLNSERSDLQVITNHRLGIEDSDALLHQILAPL